RVRGQGVHHDSRPEPGLSGVADEALLRPDQRSARGSEPAELHAEFRRRPRLRRAAILLSADEAAALDDGAGTALPPPGPAGLNPRYTFDTFIVGSSNQFAHAAC